MDERELIENASEIEKETESLMKKVLESIDDVLNIGHRTSLDDIKEVIDDYIEKLDHRIQDILSDISVVVNDFSNEVDELLIETIQSLKSKFINELKLGVMSTRVNKFVKEELEKRFRGIVFLSNVIDVIMDSKDTYSDITESIKTEIFKSMQSHQRKLTAQIVNLMGIIEEKEKEVISGTVDKLKETIDELNKQCDTLNRSLSGAIEHNTQVHDIVTKRENTIDTLNSEVASLKGTVQSLNSEIEGLKRVVESIEVEDIDDIKEKIASMSEMKGEIVEKEKIIDDRDSHISSLNDSIKSLKDNNSDLLKEINDYKSSQKSLEDKITELEKENNDLLETIDENNARWKCLLL